MNVLLRSQVGRLVRISVLLVSVVVTIGMGLEIKPSVVVGSGQPAGTTGVDPAGFPTWTYARLDDAIGSAGMLLEDLNGDGAPDMVVGCQGSLLDNRYWSILLNEGGELRPAFTSRYNTVNSQRIIRRILSFSEHAGYPLFGILFSDRMLELYEPFCHVPVEEIDLSNIVDGRNSDRLNAVLADVDGDNQLEFLISNDDDIFIIEATPPYALENQIEDVVDLWFVVGELDGTPGLEIATRTGNQGLVLNASGEVEWELPNPFNFQYRNFETMDLDGDGIEELIAAIGDKGIVFDVDEQKTKWEVTIDQISHILAGDSNGDGTPEVIFAQNQSQDIHFYSPTGQFMWSYPNLAHGISAMGLVDLNQSGVNEFIFTCGGTSSGPDFMVILDTLTQSAINPLYFDQSHEKFLVSDLNENGHEDLVLVSGGEPPRFDQGYRVQILDGMTRQLKGILINTDFNSPYTPGMVIGDIDGDEDKELVMNGVSNTLQIYDGATLALEREINSSAFSYPVKLLDVDADNELELISAIFGVKALNTTTFTEEWSHTPQGGGFLAMEVANIDGDPALEILVANWTSFYVLDGATGALERDIPIRASSIAVKNLDGDAALEVAVGNDRGDIYIFDGITFEEQDHIDVFPWIEINALEIADFHGDGDLEWFLATTEDLYLFQSLTEPPLWKSNFTGLEWGKGDRVYPRDKDGDGVMEVLVGSNLTLAEFVPKATCGNVAFLDSAPLWTEGSRDVMDLMTIYFCLEPVCP